MNRQSRPFAAFDIDGTLIRWQLYHALADVMAKQGIIDGEKYISVLRARQLWKFRQSANSFADYEVELVNLINTGIVGLKYTAYKRFCDDVIKRYQDQTYTFTRDLITELKGQGYILFAISASPIELVRQIGTYYGFDDYGASRFEVNNGKLTGREELLIGPAKQALLKQLITKHDATTRKSIAVGDTGGDIAMLQMADQAIAFNPSRELFDHATKHFWQIVIERKNVIYKLKYVHGQYILATSDN